MSPHPICAILKAASWRARIMTHINRCLRILLASSCLFSPLTGLSAAYIPQDPTPNAPAPPAPSEAVRPSPEEARPSPNEVLRSAKTIFIRSNSVYFKPSTLENSLLQQEDFQEWGLVITRDEADADLIIEVGRKLFTTSFIFSVLDPRHKRVVASGRVNSIGGTVEGKITESFMKKMRSARTLAASNHVK